MRVHGKPPKQTNMHQKPTGCCKHRAWVCGADGTTVSCPGIQEIEPRGRRPEMCREKYRARTQPIGETAARKQWGKEDQRISVKRFCSPATLKSARRVCPTAPPSSSVPYKGTSPPPSLAPHSLMQRPLPYLKKVAECNYAESTTGAISIRQTSVVSFSLSKAFLLPNCSYRIIA